MLKMKKMLVLFYGGDCLYPDYLEAIKFGGLKMGKLDIFLIQAVWCNCCNKCFCIKENNTTYYNSLKERENAVEELKKKDLRQELYSIKDGEKIRYFDNVLSYFH